MIKDETITQVQDSTTDYLNEWNALQSETILKPGDTDGIYSEEKYLSDSHSLKHGLSALSVGPAYRVELDSISISNVEMVSGVFHKQFSSAIAFYKC